MLYSSREMLDLLRSTLIHLEAAEDLDQNDPRVLAFRDSILQSMVELEMQQREAA